jgi:hypothetical protein
MRMKAILLIILAALAQAGREAPEVIPVRDPAGLQTYVITLDEEGELYGAYEATATQITVYEDAPWLESPPVRRTLLSKLRGEPHEELPQRRHERRIRQAREAGYAYVESPAGGFFVAHETKRYADRAAAMAKTAGERAPVPVPSAEAPLENLAGEALATSGSRLGHYGWYAAILGAGLLLLGFVVRKLILAP